MFELACRTFRTEAIHVVLTDLSLDMNPRTIITHAAESQVIVWTSLDNMLEMTGFFCANHLFGSQKPTNWDLIILVLMLKIAVISFKTPII